MEDQGVVNGSSRSAADGLDVSIPKPDRRSTASPSLRPINYETSFSSTLRKPQPKRVASAAGTPVASRESSPVRPYAPKSNSSSRLSGPGRTRKNSFNEPSPSRNNNANANPPSTAAPQKTFSVTSPPILSPTPTNPAIRSPIPQKATSISETREVPRWPVSPRLRSPPPINRPAAPPPRKSDPEIPAISVQQVTPASDQEAQVITASNEPDDASSTTVMRTAPRGITGGSSTLETVQEISQPNTPGLRGIDTLIENSSRASSEQDTATENGMTKSVRRKTSLTTTNESGSDSGGRGEIKLRSTSAAPSTVRTSNPPKSFSTSSAGRAKALGEGSTMTVETETVSSIPQVAVGVGAGGAGANGSLRTKPSSETIRAKKEKRRSTRKPPSATSGTTSSKADFFEAKVASAVDEANSSDSEETFVYESNPPDSNDRPRRFHSRTPSTTSMASQIDQRNGVRSMIDNGQTVAVKKSMKFTNTYSGNGEGNLGDDDPNGTIRASRGTGRGTTHHHHIGRWGRNGGNGHQSLFDNESPFSSTTTKSKLGGNNPRQSRPMSPRVGSSRLLGNGKKQSPVSSGYDLDNGADDERTPLISTVRSGRSSRSRRQGGSSLRQLEHQVARQNRSCWNRFVGCFVLLLMIVLVISGALGFMFATTQPLTDVKILALKNVLASEQELIVDMEVLAQNPNLIVVTIDAMDVVVFAKSKYAGTDSEWWNRPQKWRSRSIHRRWGIHRRDDDPIDLPPEDDPATNPNLEIGHIYEFDSPLSFEGSPLKHSLATSTGEIRVSKPGNSTTPRGSERWGQVLQHEFELIVRGTLKYTLPLGQKIRSVGVEGRITVKPNAADHDPNPGTVHTN